MKMEHKRIDKQTFRFFYTRNKAHVGYKKLKNGVITLMKEKNVTIKTGLVRSYSIYTVVLKQYKII